MWMGFPSLFLLARRPPRAERVADDQLQRPVTRPTVRLRPRHGSPTRCNQDKAPIRPPGWDDRTLHIVRCLHAARAGAVRRGARTACAPTTGVTRRGAQSVAIVVSPLITDMPVMACCTLAPAPARTLRATFARRTPVRITTRSSTVVAAARYAVSPHSTLG